MKCIELMNNRGQPVDNSVDNFVAAVMIGWIGGLNVYYTIN